MAIEEGMVTAAKLAFLTALSKDELAIALYTDKANLGPWTKEYTAAGEVVGKGYKSGGRVLTGVEVGQKGRIVYMTFDNPEWPNSAIEAAGALIYNKSKNNAAVVVLDFGEVKRSSLGMFRVRFPVPDETGAVIWIG